MRYSFYVIVKYEDSLRYQKIFGFVISFIYGNITAKGTFVVSHKFSSSDEEHLPKKLVQANLCVVTGQSKCICFRTSLTWRPRQDETLDSPITEFSSFGILSDPSRCRSFHWTGCDWCWCRGGLETARPYMFGWAYWPIKPAWEVRAMLQHHVPRRVVLCNRQAWRKKHEETFYPLSFEDRNGWMYTLIHHTIQSAYYYIDCIIYIHMYNPYLLADRPTVIQSCRYRQFPSCSTFVNHYDCV